MDYPFIQPPVLKKFEEMTREEAQVHYDWLIAQIPARIAILETAVRATPGYDSWEADGTPHSLVLLGKWFCQKITFAERGALPQQPAVAALPGGVALPKAAGQELTIEMVSIAMDVALYLSQALFQSIPDLKWKLVSVSKRDVNFQQAVIVGKGPVPFNPLHILLVYTYGIMDRTWGPNRLRELYTIWFNSLVE